MRFRRAPAPQISQSDYVRTPDPSGGRAYVEHLGGVKWYYAPVPPRRHSCWAQSRMLLDGDLVERCPCGAIRSPPWPHWTERNTSRPLTAEEQAEQDRMQAMDKLIAEWHKAEAAGDGGRMAEIRDEIMKLDEAGNAKSAGH